MALRHRQMTLEPGTNLAARHKGGVFTAKVVRRFQLADGREFKSLSAAAKAITGNSRNGYEFWSVAQPETPKKAGVSRKTKRAA
jgi:hypothetical protein